MKMNETVLVVAFSVNTLVFSFICLDLIITPEATKRVHRFMLFCYTLFAIQNFSMAMKILFG